MLTAPHSYLHFSWQYRRAASSATNQAATKVGVPKPRLRAAAFAAAALHAALHNVSLMPSKKPLDSRLLGGVDGSGLMRFSSVGVRHF